MKAYRDSVFLERKIVTWLREQGTLAGRKGCAFGLSGGIDSAVVAGLAKKAFGDEVLGVIMPCHSLSQDAQHAHLVAEALSIPCTTVDLTPSYDALLRSFPGEHAPQSSLPLANIKPRLRMTTLYALAQEKGYFVCGTGNKVELMVGYFTKHGDSGVDLLPLGELLKGEVFALGKHLGVPEEILSKPPSAGLWEGQTDEEEMGVSYSDLDSYFLSGHGPEDVTAFVQRASRRSAHKRQMPPVCPLEDTL